MATLIWFFTIVSPHMGHSVQQCGNAIHLEQELDLYSLCIYKTMAKRDDIY